jgi:hypothetical protein
MLAPACRKKASLSGRVIDPLNGQGLEGIKVVVREGRNSFSGGMTNATWTDESGPGGEFHIDYRARSGARYDYDYIVDLPSGVDVDTTAPVIKEFL